MKKFSIILASLVFMIMFAQNIKAEEYEVGDKVIINGTLGGHVLYLGTPGLWDEDYVAIILDGWNKTKNEWEEIIGYDDYIKQLSTHDYDEKPYYITSRSYRTFHSDAMKKYLQNLLNLDSLDNVSIKEGNYLDLCKWNGESTDDDKGSVRCHFDYNKFPSYILSDNINIYGNSSEFYDSTNTKIYFAGPLYGNPCTGQCDIIDNGAGVYLGINPLYINPELEKEKENYLNYDYFKSYMYNVPSKVPARYSAEINFDASRVLVLSAKKSSLDNSSIKIEKIGETEDLCKDVKTNRLFNITINYNNGKNPEVKSIEYGSNFDELPSRDGYEFAGWYYDSELRNEVSNKIETKNKLNEYGCHIGYEDVTLYAKWNKVLSNNSVKVSSYDGLDKANSISVKQIIETKDIEEKLSKLVNKFIAYNIDVLDENNQKIQVNSSVKVSIKIPEEFNKQNLVVYYLGDEMESYDVTVNGDYAEFMTNHFSEYILAEKNSKNETKNPKTGDNALLYIGASLILVLCAITITKKLNMLNK